jgi:hypothetical protein
MRTWRVTHSVRLRLGYTEKSVGKKKRGAAQLAIKYKTLTNNEHCCVTCVFIDF